LSTSELNEKWTTQSGSPSVSGSFARNGSGGLECAFGDYVRMDFADSDSISSSEFTELIIGFAHKQTSVQSSEFLRIGGNGTDTNFVRVQHNSSSGTRLLTNGTIRAYSSINDKDTDWHFYEIKASINSSTGAGDVTIRIDGEIAISVQGVPMETTSPTGFQFVDLYTSSTATYYDDLYIIDTSTGPNNDWIGEVRIESLQPDGTTSTNTDLTPSAGSNYQNVDESPPNSDTDYNSSSTVNHMDTHTTAGLTGPASVKTVYGIQVNTWSRKTDSADRDVAPVVLSNVTTVSGTSIPVTQTYNYYFDHWETDPDTGSAWTESGINSAEFGYEVSL
ncbi:MAG: hypothetical protein ACXABY_21380, partial [Candidatus Thorarchaeota archaeon]